jgi:hypothetical protein
VLTVAGAGHMNFSDAGVLYNFPFDQWGLIGPIDGRRALAIARAYLRAFFDAHIGDQPGSPLSGSAPRYPEVRSMSGFGT